MEKGIELLLQEEEKEKDIELEKKETELLLQRDEEVKKKGIRPTAGGGGERD